MEIWAHINAKVSLHSSITSAGLFKPSYSRTILSLCTIFFLHHFFHVQFLRRFFLLTIFTVICWYCQIFLFSLFVICNLPCFIHLFFSSVFICRSKYLQLAWSEKIHEFNVILFVFYTFISILLWVYVYIIFIFQAKNTCFSFGELMGILFFLCFCFYVFLLFIFILLFIITDQKYRNMVFMY